MEMLDKVELVREKTGVSYQDAKDALEACEYDVLDAIIWLENNGKADAQTASYETSDTSATQVSSAEMKEAQEEYERTSKRSRFGETWSRFCQQITKILRSSVEMTFVAERNGSRIVALPVLVMVCGLLFWGATIWLLILGLFFGFRYHIEGAQPVTINVNDAMNKAADAAENLKKDFKKDKTEVRPEPVSAPEPENEVEEEPEVE